MAKASPNDSLPGEPLMTLAEVASLFGCVERTARRKVRAGKIPPPDYRIGNAPGWKVETVERFIDAAEPKAALQ